MVAITSRKHGALIDGAGQFLTACSMSASQLVRARLVVGAGTAVGSVTGPATLAYTMDVVGKHPEHSGMLLGFLQSTGFLALAIGPAIGPSLPPRASTASTPASRGSEGASPAASLPEADRDSPGAASVTAAVGPTIVPIARPTT